MSNRHNTTRWHIHCIISSETKARFKADEPEIK